MKSYFLFSSKLQRVGETVGAIVSDVDGNFSIGALPRDILSFSFLGYETLQLKASECPTLVQMQVKANEMDELTVVGFAKQRKESVIGSIVTVTPEDLRIPSSNLTQALPETLQV